MFILPSRSGSDSYPQRANSRPTAYPSNEHYNSGAISAYGGNASSSNARSYPSTGSGHTYTMALLNGANDGGHESFTGPHISAERHGGGSTSPSQAFAQMHGHEVDSPCEQHSKYTAIRPRRDQAPLMLDTFDLGVDYPSERHTHSTSSHSDHSGDADILPQRTKGTSPMPSRPRKPRREKPRIDLAPDQPPTTQGKPRARVYVACLQCRTRKIRCDGAKPVCHNCSKRSTGNNDCNYDAVPKRRGPDRTPGARQRIAKDSKDEIDGGGPVRRRRRQRDNSYPSSGIVPEEQPEDLPAIEGRRSRSDSGSVIASSISLPSPVNADILHSPEDYSPVPNFIRPAEPQYLEGSSHNSFRRRDLELSLLDKTPSIAFDDAFDFTSLVPLSRFPLSRNVGRGFITQADEDGDDDTPVIACEPSLNFSRKIWWDSLLSLYLSPTSTRRQSLTHAQRESATQGITNDIRFLFRASNYWFAFFHIPTFFGNYHDAARRERIQPSLVLALLAMSTFWQSSDVGFGHHGRDRSLRFRDEAQSALDASFNAGWIDETLAQAAWLLALFEVCAHPLHSSERSNSSMVMLDSIIRSLSLTFVDADDPNTSIFSPGTVPAVLERKSTWFPDPASFTDFNPHMPPNPKLFGHQPHSPLQNGNDHGCSCRSMTLEHQPEGSEHTPLWASTPAWKASWSEGEIRKESCRRLCWSSMILAAGHASYTTAHRSHALNLFISDPSNYALLFSGESIAYSPALSSSHSSKDTIWALYDRSFLLWHGCIRMRNDTRATDIDKAEFAVKAWLEADALESALNRHTCRIERAFIFQAREYIFNTRMCISHEFQRFIPLVTANVSGLFHRNKAEEWLTHQATVAERFMYGLHTITGNSNNLLARRPFFVFWFMGQISRSLSLWECDNTLTVALDVCKALLPALDYLTALWPCPEQRYRYEGLHERLANACYVAGVNPPPPVNLTLPPPSSPVALV